MTELTKKQLTILTLLYRFNYLDRTHIQRLLKHTDHHGIQIWLNDLTTNNYITKYYLKTIQSKPAIYALTQTGQQKVKQYYKEQGKDIKFSRQLKDENRILALRAHSLAVAEVYLGLVTQDNSSKDTISVTTRTELKLIKNLLSPRPDLYIVITSPASDVRRYFLDQLDDIPTPRLRRRARQYIDYYESDQWQDNTDKPFPEIILVCPNQRIKFHLQYYLRSKLDEDDLSKFKLELSDADTL